MVNVSSGETKPLLHLVAEEARTVQQFVDLLNREQTALSAGKTDELPALAEQKSTLANDLVNLDKQRNDLLAAMGFKSGRKGVEAWCTKYPAEQAVADTWATILRTATEARELSRLNGDLIQLRLNVTAKALQALQAGKSSLDLYGPDGQATNSGQRRIDHAV